MQSVEGDCGNHSHQGTTFLVAKVSKAKKGDQPKPAVDPVHPVRSSVRFPLRLELLIETEEGELPAVTEDVSASGVLFSMETLPAIHSRVEFTITMPGEAMGSEKDVTVQCTGRIVRHEQTGQVRRAAAVIDEYILKA